jgi:hypothetical protein
MNRKTQIPIMAGACVILMLLLACGQLTPGTPVTDTSILITASPASADGSQLPQGPDGTTLPSLPTSTPVSSPTLGRDTGSFNSGM